MVRWRDLLFTLLMWGLFAVLLAEEIGLLWLHSLGRFGLGAEVPIQWAARLARLQPFLWASAVLALALAGFSVITLRQRRRALLLPPPAPLSDASQAERLGVEATDLAAARKRVIVVVAVDPEGRARLEDA